MDADEELRQAADYATIVLQRVSGGGGIASQIAAGEWGGKLDDAQSRELAGLLRVMSEKVRHTRELAGTYTPPMKQHAVEPRAAASFDHPLPPNRKERYYTGTVLPMLVASDGFAHLHRLLALCGLPQVDIDSGLDTSQDLQLFTEYGFAESVHTDADKAKWSTDLAADTPDVVIAGPDWLLAVEAKMFHNPSGRELEGQMRRQETIVDLWRDHLHLDPPRVKHVLLLPERLSRRVGELGYPVVTWEDLLDEYARVGPRYWVDLLGVALARHSELESAHKQESRINADDILTGAEIVEAHAEGAASFHFVGRRGGRNGERFRSDVSTGNWRTTRYEVRIDDAPNRNWFPLADFLTAVSGEQSS